MKKPSVAFNRRKVVASHMQPQLIVFLSFGHYILQKKEPLEQNYNYYSYHYLVYLNISLQKTWNVSLI